LAVILVEADDGLNNTTAEEATAVIVDIEAEIESRAKGVLAVDPRDVVHQLRVVIARCVWRKAVWPVDVQRRASTQSSAQMGTFWDSEVGVGLAEGELKREAVKPGRELIH